MRIDGLIPASLSLLLAGCAPLLARGVPEVPWPLPDSSYLVLKEASASVESLPLRGRVIVVDPGHGGPETGAVGRAGLCEKDVNLGVARALVERLRAAGATAILTRSADVAVAPAGASLSEELRARAEVANARQADLFVSIHHNATMDSSNQLDTTETYFKMDDPGPSQDVAAAIHRHLALNLGLPKERLAPGNYAVLRQANVPAVLGEASYLSNPLTEQKLMQSAAWRVEAESYLAGILEYFSRGTPRITRLAVRGPATEPTGIQASMEGGGAAIDPTSVMLGVDGQPLDFTLDPLTGGVSAVLPTLSNGTHPGTLAMRNVRGNWARSATFSLEVARVPAMIQAQCPMGVVAPDGPVPLVAQVSDALGLPVADAMPVTFEVTSGQLLGAPALTVAGRAGALWLGASPGATVSVHAGAASTQFVLPGAGRAFFGVVRSMDGQGVGGALVEAGRGAMATAVKTSPEGLFFFPSPPKAGSELRISAAGFGVKLASVPAPRFIETRLEPEGMAPWTGQLVVLNPEGGPEDRDPARRQVAAFNWQVADDLRDYLEAAGVRVALTRGPGDTPTDIARVQLANSRSAALFLTLGHPPSDAVRSAHYPTSARGKAIAESLRQAMLRYLPGARDGRTTPDATYTLIQTTCPSVTVWPNSPATPPEPAQARREAYALYLGLKGSIVGGGIALSVTGAGGRPVADALVQLDGRWVGQTDQGGTWRFMALAPGRHVVSATDGSHGRTVRVEDLQPGETRSVLCELPAGR